MSRYWLKTDTSEYFETSQDHDTFPGAVAVPQRQHPEDTWNAGTGTWSARPLADLKSSKLDALAEYRWMHEHGGFLLPDDTPVDTSPRTRAFMTAAYIKADKDPTYQIDAFKSGPDAFGSLTALQIIAIGDAIDAFVQACFLRESVLSALIMAAGNEAELDAIDIKAGWP